MQKINDNLWVIDQKQKYHGIEIGTRMTIIRLDNNKLLLISPIIITDSISKALSALGEIHFIIAPNIYHHLYLRDCSQRYPKADVYVASGLESKYTDLKCTVLTSSAPEQWCDFVDQILFDGYAGQEISGPVVLNEVVFFHKESKTLILTDSAFHFVPSSFIAKMLTKILGMYDVLGPSILEKRAIKHPEKTKKALEKIMEWPFEAVIMAHGEIVTHHGKLKLQAGYKWLLR